MSEKVRRMPMPMDPSKFEDLKCSCGHEFFDVVNRIKKISPLVSKSGKTEIIPIPVLRCLGCGNIIEEI